MVHGENPVERRSLPDPVDADIWEQILGVGWEKRGAFVAMMIASRYRFYLTEQYADDVFGEALCRCVGKFGGRDSMADLLAQSQNEGQEAAVVIRRLLRGFIKNVILELMRQARRRPGDFSQGPEPAGVPAEQTIDEDSAKRLIERVGATLTTRQKEVFRLFYLSDRTQSAVASELGISVATVNREVERIRVTFYDACAVPLPEKGGSR